MGTQSNWGKWLLSIIALVVLGLIAYRALFDLLFDSASRDTLKQGLTVQRTKKDPQQRVQADSLRTEIFGQDRKE